MTQQLWWNIRHEVVAFGRVLHTVDLFAEDDPAVAVIEYFAAPWNWTREHDWWVWNGRTDDLFRWDDAADNNFQVDYEVVS